MRVNDEYKHYGYFPTWYALCDAFSYEVRSQVQQEIFNEVARDNLEHALWVAALELRNFL